MSRNIGLICQRDVVTIREADDLTAAAQRMREKHVGYLIVAEPDALDKALKPVGVLTDRDIVVAVVARGVDPHALKVGDVMTRKPVVITEDDSIEDSVREMRRIGVRRMPVISQGGNLVGVVSIDDVLETLAEELGNIAGTIRNEQRTESALRT
jgi:CBS domain-containing protein